LKQADLEDFRLSSLQNFFAKVAIVTSALLVLIYFTTSLATSFLSTQNRQFGMLGGGPAFWGAVEQKLYDLADAPDAAPEKKKKIVDALHRLSLKYKPYLDALGGDGLPADQERKKAQP